MALCMCMKERQSSISANKSMPEISSVYATAQTIHIFFNRSRLFRLASNDFVSNAKTAQNGSRTKNWKLRIFHKICPASVLVFSSGSSRSSSSALTGPSSWLSIAYIASCCALHLVLYCLWMTNRRASAVSPNDAWIQIRKRRHPEVFRRKSQQPNLYQLHGHKPNWASGCHNGIKRHGIHF